MILYFNSLTSQDCYFRYDETIKHPCNLDATWYIMTYSVLAVIKDFVMTFREF